MRMPPVPRLVASRVSCMRSGKVIIREVNMTLDEGGAMLLTGPNASGKSTFLRLLASFLKPSAGKLLWDGLDLSLPGLYDEYKTQIHIVGSKDAIKAQLSVHENVYFWEMLEGGEGRTVPALQYMGLGSLIERKAAVLSLGQKKRLQLARLLAIPRPIWLLDEPSVGLDSKGVELLEQIMADHRRKGGMVLVATHIPIDLQDCMHLRFPPRFDETGQAFGGP
ncbi:unnamed protein product [Calypogeia fissa]